MPSQTIVLSILQPVATSSATSGSVQRTSYGNNEAMSATIAPTGAASVTLQFITISTESGYDLVTVKSCTAIGCSQTSELGRYSGTTIPSPVTSNTGIMLIQWTSDSATSSSGWSATWSSTRAGFVVCFTSGIWYYSPTCQPTNAIPLLYEIITYDHVLYAGN